MRIMMLAAAIAAVSFGTAGAGEAVKASNTTAVLYVCDSSELTRRSFAREHGTATFVTAEAARRGGWEGARCISPVEFRRLQQLRTAPMQSASLR